MAYGAVRQVSGVDVVARGELVSDLGLVLRRLPLRIEHGLVGTQVRFGRAMAVQAPLHGQWRSLPHQPHLPDVAVAGGAADALGDMDRMIEIDVVGKPV